MRFSNLLSQISEKAQLRSPFDTKGSSIQHLMPAQALPIYHSIFRLGLVVSGSFGFLCTPALADLAQANIQTNAQTNIQTNTQKSEAAFITMAPIHSSRANLNSSSKPYDDYKIALEDTHRPKFSHACRQLTCGADTIAPSQEKTISDGSKTTAAADLIRLLSQPAAGHVGKAEIPVPNLNSNTTSQNAIDLPASNGNSTRTESMAVAQVPDFVDALPGRRLPQIRNTAGSQPDDELGNLRVQLERSRQNEDLGILRLLQTAQAPPPPPKEPIAFLAGRVGFFDTDNALRTQDRLGNQIYQTGLSVYIFPKLSENTSLYAIAETSLGRYEESGFTIPRPTPSNPEGQSKPINPNYDQLELEFGLRQRLAARTYAQIGLRNQQVYSPGYRDKIFGANYIEAQVNHRSILNSKTWLDSFYEVQLGFTQAERNPTNIRDPKDGRDAASRLRQTLTLSFNYAATKDLRTSLLYQLDYEDYTQTVRNDFYQQVLGVISYNLTPESRLSLFAGTRFGRSSEPGINLDDTFYGAGLNIVVPF